MDCISPWRRKDPDTTEGPAREHWNFSGEGVYSFQPSHSHKQLADRIIICEWSSLPKKLTQSYNAKCVHLTN